MSTPVMTYLALEQAVFAALTTPTFQYALNGATLTLPASNIFSGEPIDVPDPTAIDPMVTFAVGGRGKVTPALPFRDAFIRISVSTGLPYGKDIVEQIYAVILGRLESKDAETPNQLTRVASGGALALAALKIEEVDKRAAAFDGASQRYYVGSQLNAIVR